MPDLFPKKQFTSHDLALPGRFVDVSKQLTRAPATIAAEAAGGSIGAIAAYGAQTGLGEGFLSNE